MSRLLIRRLRQSVDHVLWRPDLRVPAPEVDEWLPLERSVPSNLRQQRREVLLRKPLDALRRWSHRPILCCEPGMAVWDNLSAESVDLVRLTQAQVADICKIEERTRGLARRVSDLQVASWTRRCNKVRRPLRLERRRIR